MRARCEGPAPSIRALVPPRTPYMLSRHRSIHRRSVREDGGIRAQPTPTSRDGRSSGARCGFKPPNSLQTGCRRGLQSLERSATRVWVCLPVRPTVCNPRVGVPSSPPNSLQSACGCAFQSAQQSAIRVWVCLPVPRTVCNHYVGLPSSPSNSLQSGCGCAFQSLEQFATTM